MPENPKPRVSPWLAAGGLSGLAFVGWALLNWFVFCGGPWDKMPAWGWGLDALVFAGLGVAAAVGVLADTASSAPDVAACKGRLQTAGWMAGEDRVPSPGGPPRVRVVATRDGRTVTGEGADARAAWRDALARAEALLLGPEGKGST
jgi:hypothetical protein